MQRIFKDQGEPERLQSDNEGKFKKYSKSITGKAKSK